ncbi:MAG: photosystem II reaction center protein Psb28 [Cyanobacteriota bacterium]|nr:photosystem II reaction center protein Psb28 [Cyanobacteriota bacterium]
MYQVIDSLPIRLAQVTAWVMTMGRQGSLIGGDSGHAVSENTNYGYDGRAVFYLSIMSANIEFSRGIVEVPSNVRLLKSKNSSRSSAIFRFEEVKADTQNILSMVMTDEEGELQTRELRAKFLNGEFKAIEVIYEMQTEAEWDRFMRFMERFSADHEMGLGETGDP